MTCGRWWWAMVLVGVTALAIGEVVSQNPNRSGESDPGELPRRGAASDAESLVDIWVQHAMPTEHHKLLDKMVGSWKMAVKYQMNAEAAVVESAGSCGRKWILGKRFVLEEFDGGNLALPFQGLAIYGYDSFEAKYTSVWVDTTGTAITTNFGTCQEDCKVITFVGQHGDPWTGVKRTSRGITRFVDANKHVLELYETGSEGKEFRVLEIVYTRQSQPLSPTE